MACSCSGGQEAEDLVYSKKGRKQRQRQRGWARSLSHSCLSLGSRKNSAPTIHFSLLTSALGAPVLETTRGLVPAGEISSVSWHNPPWNLQEESLNLSLQLPCTVMWQPASKASSARGVQRTPCHQHSHWASLLAQKVKDLPATQETWVQPLGRENPLQKLLRD